MNTGLLKTYDPKQVICTFGTTIITDFAEGTFIDIKQEAGFESVKGADGSENRINKNITGADVSITLSQTSLSNDALSAMHIADKVSNMGAVPLMIKDLSGTTQLYSALAYIKKLPDTQKADKLGNRVWEIRATQVVFNVGGNL